MQPALHLSKISLFSEFFKPKESDFSLFRYKQCRIFGMPTFQISVFVGRWETDEAKKPTIVVKLLRGLIVLFLKVLEIFTLQSSSGHLNSSELLNFSLVTSSEQMPMSIRPVFNTVGTLALLALNL